MKKILLFICAITFFAALKANPLVPPFYHVTEFAFDAKGDWVIELLRSGDDISTIVDSITIKSSTGSAKWKNINATNGNSFGYIVLRNDSMLSNLSINPLGDKIEVFSYFGGVSYGSSPTEVAFGNYPNSIIKAPKVGQSISVIPFYYCGYLDKQEIRWECGIYSIDISHFSLDNSPGFGLNCDSTGMYGTIKGNIYDANNKLITDMSLLLEFPDNPRKFSPKADGSYSTYLFANRAKFSTITAMAVPTSQTWAITPIEIDMDPNSVVTADIHLINFAHNSINEIQEEAESIIKIFPNPVKDLSINYEIEIPVRSATSLLEVLNLEGQIIAVYTICNNNGKIDLPANIKNGTYIVNLVVNNKKYSSTKVLINR